MSHISSTSEKKVELNLSKFEMSRPFSSTSTYISIALAIIISIGIVVAASSGYDSTVFYAACGVDIIGALGIVGIFIHHYLKNKYIQSLDFSTAKNAVEYEKMVNKAKGTMWRTKAPKYLDYYSKANTELEKQTEIDIPRLDVFFEKEIISDKDTLRKKISNSSIKTKEQVLNLCNQTTLNQFNDILSSQYITKSTNGNPLINVSKEKNIRPSISLFNEIDKWYIKYQISLRTYSLEPEKVFGYFNITAIVDLDTGDAVISWNSPAK